MTKLHSVTSMFRRGRAHQHDRTPNDPTPRGTKRVRFNPDVLVYGDGRDAGDLTCLWYNQRDYACFRSAAYRAGRDRCASDAKSDNWCNYSRVIRELMAACIDEASVFGIDDCSHSESFVSTIRLRHTLRLLLRREPDLEGLHKYCPDELFQHKRESLAKVNAAITDTKQNPPYSAEDIQRLTRPSCLFARIMAQASAFAVGDLCETKPFTSLQQQGYKQSACKRASYHTFAMIPRDDSTRLIYGI